MKKTRKNRTPKKTQEPQRVHLTQKQTPEELSKNGGKHGKKGNAQGDSNKKRRQPEFLSVLAEKGIVTDACLAIGVSRKTAYEWRSTDEHFSQAWKYALEEYKESLEKEADRRAVEGVDHPVTFNGKITDTYKQYSDTLLIFRLKKLDPDYKDRQQVEYTGEVGITIIEK